LALHYQPVVDIRNGRPAGAEALVRLTGADGKLESPKSFLSIAESTGLITELGEWVVGEACRQQRAWSSEDMHLAIAINVSPLEFRQRNFAERLRRILSNSGVDPACLQLEVTESTVMENLDEAVAILNNITSLGMKVALDDVGTGYSSLSSLSRLPLDKLKVDQSFVRRIESDRASRAVTEAIIALGRTLKLDVIGEGIESRHTLDYLEEHGCNQAQGFLFSRPLPAAEFAGWYRRHMQ
jgi:EAL domain-containing protein (putative c-di-GMP-specific phosphodiesterase class I)